MRRTERTTAMKNLTVWNVCHRKDSRDRSLELLFVWRASPDGTYYLNRYICCIHASEVIRIDYQWYGIMKLLPTWVMCCSTWRMLEWVGLGIYAGELATFTNSVLSGASLDGKFPTLDPLRINADLHLILSPPSPLTHLFPNGRIYQLFHCHLIHCVRTFVGHSVYIGGRLCNCDYQMSGDYNNWKDRGNLLVRNGHIIEGGNGV